MPDAPLINRGSQGRGREGAIAGQSLDRAALCRYRASCFAQS